MNKRTMRMSCNSWDPLYLYWFQR